MMIVRYKMRKKIIASLLLVAVFVTSLAPNLVSPVRAQEWWRPSLQEFQVKVDQGAPNDIFGERYTFAQVNWIIMSLITIIEGKTLSVCSNSDNFVTAAGCVQGRISNPNAYIDSPILALGAASDGLLRNRPASGIQWTKDVAANFHLVPEAKAQTTGAGFQSLQLTQRLWKASRDFAFALMTLAIVAMAFMIMFRVKISPQAAITVQSAIPRVAIAMVLIYFSYAIAGFLIDIAYIVMGIFALMFTSGGASSISSLSGGALAFFKQLNDGFGGIMSLGIAYALSVVIGGIGVGLIGGLFTGGAAFVPVILGGLVIAIIVIIIFLFAALRIFWLLLQSYITLILQVIIAPYYILLGVVSPSIGFGGWIRSYLATVSVFPVTAILIMFAHFMFWSTQNLMPANNSYSSLMVNPFQITSTMVGNTGGMPAFGSGISSSFIGFAGGLVVMLGIPNIAKSIKNMFGKPMFAYGNALSGAVPGFVSGTYRQGTAEVQKRAGRVVGGQAYQAVQNYTSRPDASSVTKVVGNTLKMFGPKGDAS